jgi:hypothetical protein
MLTNLLGKPAKLKKNDFDKYFAKITYNMSKIILILEIIDNIEFRLESGFSIPLLTPVGRYTYICTSVFFV